MKQYNLAALLLALVLALCGCKQETPAGTLPMDALFEKTASAVEEGHFFFTGKVTSALAEPKMITFYDVEAEKSTFYKVEITDDPFGCLPERTVTLCVLGNSENFADRMPLVKGKEYIFDTTLWVQQEEVCLLLPTFYKALPERQGDVLYYTDQSGTMLVSGSYQDYWKKLRGLAEEKGYGPASVLEQIRGRLQEAVKRDIDYFEALDFTAPDRAAVAATVTKARALLAQAESAEPNWNEIKELLK